MGLVISIFPLTYFPGLAEATPQVDRSSLARLKSSQFIDRGTELLLNGKIMAIPWARWQVDDTVHLGISDTALDRQFGVRLFDGDTQNQPVDWDASQRSRSINLPVKLTSEYRYLDITRVAQRIGWKWDVFGYKLKLDTPAAKIIDVQRKTIDRDGMISIRLDRYTPWKLSQTPTEGYLTIAATTDSALLTGFNAPPTVNDPNFDPDDDPTAKKLEYKVTSNNGQTIIQFPIVRGQRAVARLSSPTDLQVRINSKSDTIATRSINWAPGLKWQQKWVSLGNDKFPVTYLELNPQQQGLKLRPMIANEPNLVGSNHLIKFAPSVKVAAAINGGYFNRKTRMPLGAIKRDGKWLSSPILNRGSIGWNDRGEIQIDRLTMQETLTTSTGKNLSILGLNSGYAQAGIARYTREWGNSYTPIQVNESIVVVDRNKVIEIIPGTNVNGINIPIPATGYLLTLRGQTDLSASLPVGTSLKIDRQTVPSTLDRYPQIVGAGPLLVQSGKIVLDVKGENFSLAFGKETAVRSAIAKTYLGNIILVTVHDRSGGKGPTLAEMAQLLQQMGAVDALNLDGGSSTSLYLGGQLIDRASATAARVHNGIGVFLNP